MSKEDDAYKTGYNAGRDGWFLDDVAEGVSKGMNLSKCDEVYEKGYEQGARDRAEYGRRDNDSGSSGNDSSSSSGGCFLTTACLEHAHLPDDCQELQTMRRFRDEYIRGLPDGATLLEDYYRVAPRIVQRIKSQADPDEAFGHLLVALRQAVALVEAGHKPEALDVCTREFTKLKEKYLCDAAA
ncbi:MAG: hypothetical protein HYY24_20545 [Verrucomicrobia bacterium]|nr:hypothetical protein [Verrucomicrobiota bacterium]